jgi:hypothetical protein
VEWREALRAHRTPPHGDAVFDSQSVIDGNLRGRTLSPLVERLHLGTPAGPSRRTLLFEWGRMVLQHVAEEN